MHAHERFTCITGVSGSGKSTLLFDVLWAAAAEDKNAKSGEVRGLGRYDTIYVVDQLPIGTTPASNPATYTKAFDPIRKLFAQMPDARLRGFDGGAVRTPLQNLATDTERELARCLQPLDQD